MIASSDPASLIRKPPGILSIVSKNFAYFPKNIFLEPLAQFDRGQPVRISCASPASSRCDRLYPLNTPVRACAVAGRQGVLDFAQMASEAERGA